MQYWREYKGHSCEVLGKSNKIDNTVYTFDIETTSYLILNNRVYQGLEYLNFSDSDRKNSIKHI